MPDFPILNGPEFRGRVTAYECHQKADLEGLVRDVRAGKVKPDMTYGPQTVTGITHSV
jgi:hypothetical protein